MRELIRAAAVGGVMAMMASAAGAAVDPEMVTAAKQIQNSCVAKGEDARVCACGTGLAYGKLDPKVFKLMPKIEPLMANPDKGAQMMGVLSMASQSGLSVTDLQAAYDVIRANRETVNAVCKPLAPGSKPKKP